VMSPRATMLTVALVATLAGGGSASAQFGNEGVTPDTATEIAVETTAVPIMELPNGCVGDDWGSEGSID